MGLLLLGGRTGLLAEKITVASKSDDISIWDEKWHQPLNLQKFLDFDNLISGLSDPNILFSQDFWKIVFLNSALPQF